MAQVKAIPERLHSITPNLVCRNAAGAIDFYKKAFGATELDRIAGPGGVVMHAELKIGDSVIFVAEPMARTLPAQVSPGSVNPMYLHLYVSDVDAVFQRAVDAGARVEMAVSDMFWGDRYGMITDPFGQQWGIATHKEDVTPEELAKRTQAMLAQRGAGTAAAS